ncbi:Hypothetical protein Cp226_2087 [Corynebacterium pseudotuberculosis]|nr:Hypothetical protein Cp226_2087 [Corynebacterium pseudotuberculosis]
MALDSFARVGIFVRCSHITTTEIDFALVPDSSGSSKGVIGEYLKASSNHDYLLLRVRIDVNSSKPWVRPRQALTHTPQPRLVPSLWNEG